MPAAPWQCFHCLAGMCRLGCPPPKDQVFVLARVSGCVFGCAVLSVAIIWVGCVVTPKGGGGILQRAAGHSQCLARCSRTEAVQTYWPRLDSKAEGDKDAICHITCPNPVSSGCVAGLSHNPLCPEQAAQLCCKTPPGELRLPGEELLEVPRSPALGHAVRGDCHSSALLCAWLLGLKYRPVLAYLHSVR